MQTRINFLFKEIITCGAVLSGFELCQALRHLGLQCDIVSDYRNEELEQYFDISPVIHSKRIEGIDITFTPKIEGEYAYVRTKDERWKTHKSKKIVVSKYLQDWLGDGKIISNGTHSRFYDMGLERDIDILIVGNDEENKNIPGTLEKARSLGKGARIVWFGRHTVPGNEYENITNPSLDEIPRLYNRAKVFLSMSKDEGWSRPIAEAMACGCEVINLNGGNREIEIVSWESIAKELIIKLKIC